MPSSVDVMSYDGKLSLDAVARTDPEFARAAREGLTWTVLSHRVRLRFPVLLSFIQRAMNTPNAAAALEHEIQVMLRMHALAADAQRRSLDPDWESIRRSAALTMPPCVDDLCSAVCLRGRLWRRSEG